MSAWNRSTPLSSRLAASLPPPPTPLQRQDSLQGWSPSHPSFIPYPFHYQRMVVDGANFTPKEVTIDENQTSIVGLTLYNGRNQSILVIQEGGELSIPTEAMEKKESMEMTLQRILTHVIIPLLNSISYASDSTSTSSPPDFSSLLNGPFHLQSVEHFPSLKTNWTRHSFVIYLDSQNFSSFQLENITSSPLFYNVNQLISIQETAAAPSSSASSSSSSPSLTVASDIVRVLHSIQSIPFHHTPSSPSIHSRSHSLYPISYPYHLVELCILYQHKYLLTHSLSYLPTTHLDKGESLKFSAKRLLRALLGISFKEKEKDKENEKEMKSEIKEKNNGEGERKEKEREVLFPRVLMIKSDGLLNGVSTTIFYDIGDESKYEKDESFFKSKSFTNITTPSTNTSSSTTVSPSPSPSFALHSSSFGNEGLCWVDIDTEDFTTKHWEERKDILQMVNHIKQWKGARKEGEGSTNTNSLHIGADLFDIESFQ